MTTFQPTHEITFKPSAGEARVTLVALVDGAAYSREEWEGETAADWERTEDGRWLFQGQVTPGGAAGEVTVRKIAIQAGATASARVTRAITVVYDRRCRAGQIPLIWGVSEGSGFEAMHEALADAVTWSEDGLWSLGDCVTILWPVGAPLPDGQDRRAIELAAEVAS